MNLDVQAIARLDDTTRDLVNALLVFVLDSRLRGFAEKVDPKALAQATLALEQAGVIGTIPGVTCIARHGDEVCGEGAVARTDQIYGGPVCSWHRKTSNDRAQLLRMSRG
jgi:hypothetical protein